MNQGIKSDRRIGDNIQAARKQQHWSQEQFAAKLQTHGCDLSRGTLAKIEAGIRHISMAELNAIKDVLGIEYDELFRDTGGDL